MLRWQTYRKSLTVGPPIVPHLLCKNQSDETHEGTVLAVDRCHSKMGCSCTKTGAQNNAVGMGRGQGFEVGAILPLIQTHDEPAVAAMVVAMILLLFLHNF